MITAATNCGVRATLCFGQASILTTDRPWESVQQPWGRHLVQSAQPRDLAALAFVVSLFAVLLVVSLVVGAPAR